MGVWGGLSALELPYGGAGSPARSWEPGVVGNAGRTRALKAWTLTNTGALDSRSLAEGRFGGSRANLAARSDRLGTPGLRLGLNSRGPDIRHDPSPEAHPKLMTR